MEFTGYFGKSLWYLIEINRLSVVHFLKEYNMGPSSTDTLKLQLESVMISLLPAFLSSISNVFLFSFLMIYLDFYFPSHWKG